MGASMDFPEIITRLPEAILPFPSSVVKTSVLQSVNGQLVFLIKLNGALSFRGNSNLPLTGKPRPMGREAHILFRPALFTAREFLQAPRSSSFSKRLTVTSSGD